MSAFYEDFVPTYVQLVEAQLKLVDKAEAFCAAKGIAPETLLEERLAPDMLPLKFQFQQVVRHSAGALANFTGTTAPQGGGDDFATIRQGLADALAFLKSVKPDDLVGAESKPLALEMRAGVMKFTGRDFITSFSLPNFMFHAAASYAILRKAGAEIGKRDFMGKLRMAS